MKYGNFFTQIMTFSQKKVDDLRARERKRQEKGTTNSAPGTELNRLKCKRTRTSIRIKRDETHKYIFPILQFGFKPNSMYLGMLTMTRGASSSNHDHQNITIFYCSKSRKLYRFQIRKTRWLDRGNRN